MNEGKVTIDGSAYLPCSHVRDIIIEVGLEGDRPITLDQVNSLLLALELREHTLQKKFRVQVEDDGDTFGDMTVLADDEDHAEDIARDALRESFFGETYRWDPDVTPSEKGPIVDSSLNSIDVDIDDSIEQKVREMTFYVSEVLS